MSFVYCRNCDWQQDDFWSVEYNPFAAGGYPEIFTAMLEKPLQERYMVFDIGFLRVRQLPAMRQNDGSYKVQFREILVRRLEDLLHRVKTMTWWTWEDFKADSNPCCPICQSRELVID